MARRKKKRVREKGKLRLSHYFQELKQGERVAIKPEVSLQPAVPLRFRGKIGIVEGKRGRAYIIKFKDGNMEKKLILKPIHLVKV